MTDRALGTLARPDKGPREPPPMLDGPLGAVAEAVTGWPGVVATTHWHLYEPSRIDGIDFYVGERELGHIHLDGSVHLATSPNLGAALVTEGRARPFPYQRGWVCETVRSVGSDAAVALFRSNYEAITACDRASSVSNATA